MRLVTPLTFAVWAGLGGLNGCGARSESGGFCPDADSFIRRCPESVPSSCARETTDSCPKLLTKYSAGFIAAFSDCADTLSCYADPFGNECVGPRLISIAPTPTQEALADAVCRACAKGPVVHEQGLSCKGHVLGAGSTGQMLSTSILAMSDANAQKMRSTCVEPAMRAFPNDYDNCENHFLNCVEREVFLSVPAICSNAP